MDQILSQVLSTNNLALIFCVVALVVMFRFCQYLLKKITDLETKFENYQKISTAKFENLHQQSTDEILKLSIKIAKIEGKKEGAEIVANKLAKELNGKIDKLVKAIDNR